MGLVEEIVDSESLLPRAIVQKAHRAPHIRVSPRCRHLFGSHQQQLVVVRLIMLHLIEVSLRVMVRDRKKVELLLPRSLKQTKGRARYIFA